MGKAIINIKTGQKITDADITSNNPENIKKVLVNSGHWMYEGDKIAVTPEQGAKIVSEEVERLVAEREAFEVEKAAFEAEREAFEVEKAAFEAEREAFEVEKAAAFTDHTVTAEDLEENPSLMDEGVAAGDTIEIPANAKATGKGKK